MYHEGHPDKDYETANRVELFDEAHAIAWKPSVGLVTGAVGWSCRDVFVCEVG